MDPSAPASTAPAQPHRLGVLFVHGIGDQPQGDTLRGVVDPVVQSLDLWLHGAARCRARLVGAAAAQAWAAAVPDALGAGPCGRRVHEQAFEMAWSAEWDTDELSPAQVAALQASDYWSGSALLTDGHRPPGGPQAGDEGAPGAPPHAVLRVHALDGRYTLREGTALLAECWWARSFVPPSPWALVGWTFQVLPLAVGMHFGDVVRRHAALAADAPVSALRKAWHALLAVLSLLLMLLAVPLALPLQALLVATALLSMLPIGALRAAMQALQSTLVGTLGDSYLLVASPVSRAMIVARCKRDLQWLAERCDQVLLVAHSQGCAVSYLALCEALPGALREVAWIGSGLRKLEVLRAAERDRSVISAGWLVATMPLLLWSELTRGDWAWDSAPWRALGIVLMAAAYLYGMIRLVLLLRTGATAIWLRVWQAMNLRLTELYATHDPVPHGPLFDGSSQHHAALAAQPVRNRASWWSDHNSYWRNVEEVVLPLALRIAAGLGVPVQQLLADDPALLARAVRRRHQRVRTLVGLRTLLLAGAAVALWLDAAVVAGAARGLADWAAQMLGAAAPQGPTLAATLLAAAPTLGWALLPWVVLALAWRGWEAHEQRCLLLRCPPADLPEMGLLAAMVAAACVPAGRAATLAWGERGLGMAIALILVGSVAVAVVDVLQRQSPRRAFGFGPTPPRRPPA